jgi:hypothetical protein
MFETPEEIDRLQRVLDESYERAGSHLASIHSVETRLSATDLVSKLDGMQIFVLATSGRDGRPRTGPVDTFLYRGEVRFGTAEHSLRARHLARNRAASATHVRGEALVVTVHGDARRLDLTAADADFGDFLKRHYGPDAFGEHLAGAPYYGITPRRLFAADMSLRAGAPAD